GGEIPTPHLDALAREGVRFSNFHVAASCAPTRAMLFTGVEHHRAGVGNLLESMPREHLGKPGYLGSLAPNVVTVASLLQAGGYRTLISGKWNVGTEPHNLPNARGFDRSIVQGDTGSDNWDPTQRYLPHSKTVKWFEDGRTATMPERFYTSEWFVDRMIGYLREEPDTSKPFFAVVGFQANHVPLQAPAEFIAKHRGRYDAGWTALRAARRDRAAELGLVPRDVPMATMPTTADWNRLSDAERRHQARGMEVYAAMAEAMDHHIGRLVDHLKASGRYEDTVFVFLSDNGPEGSDYRDAQLWLRTQYTQDTDRLGGPGAYAIPGPSWASASAAPLSGYKFFAGEGGIRVPLIVAGVPGAASGSIHAGLAHVIDIAPTLLELAGVAHPAGARARTDAGSAATPPDPGSASPPVEPLAGRSLLPVLRDPQARLRAPDESIGYELSGNRALYRGDLKLTSSLAPLGDGRWRLYDLKADPGETRDLAESMPTVVAAMRAEYEDWARAHGVLPMPEGYTPTKQVMINSVLNYWLPEYGPIGAAVLAASLALVVVLLARRRARRRGAR
ncbi:MAG: arylsulfatase, partial [Burkholderiales bacterium]